MYMISVRDVTVVVDEITLMRPVSIEIERGEALIVRGPNGAGKSTFLRVLAGLLAPTSGRATIDDTTISGRDAGFRRTVSAMIGLPPEAPDLTVIDHLKLVAATWFGSVREASEAAGGLLKELGLTELGERFPHELSSGQRQLFGLALALVRPFDVLILDEPEQRLDSDHLDTVINVLQKFRASGKTLVLATHNDELVSAVGDRTLELDRTA